MKAPDRVNAAVRMDGFTGLRLALCAAWLALLASCGGGGGSPAVSTAPPPEQMAPVDESPRVLGSEPGVSPFIALLKLRVPEPDALASVRFRVLPKPAALARPVSARYGVDYLDRDGRLDKPSGTLTVPLFGLYAGHANDVELEIQDRDGALTTLRTQVQTAVYVDPQGVYDRAQVLKARASTEAIGYDFIHLKAASGSPVVVDTDGALRWTVPGVVGSMSSIFDGTGFVVGSNGPVRLQRVELDGRVRDLAVNDARLVGFHHNIDPGKDGVLTTIDSQEGGVSIIESQVFELDPDTGAILKEWDMARIFSALMTAGGDDPAAFVRPGVDWFHVNAVAYDPRDDSLIVSSRENFVVKVGYEDQAVRWILGDPTKYWHQFPSLAAKGLTMPGGGLYPIGQHAVSITQDGLLQLFNNGRASLNQPAAAPIGEDRSFSAVSFYAIDEGAGTATEVRQFDYGQSILSQYCSSSYEADAAGNLLVNYALADGGAHARLVGVDSAGSVAFDLEFPTSGCGTSWNATSVAWDDLRFE